MQMVVRLGRDLSNYLMAQHAFATVRLPAQDDKVYGAAMRAFEELQRYANVVTENDLDNEKKMVLRFILQK